VKAGQPAPASIFYQTWARRDDFSIKTWLEFSNVDAMQDAVTQGYAEYAQKLLSEMNSAALPHNEVLIAPVGEIWRQVYHDTNAPVSFAQLFNDDGTHPSLHGSYLAACTIFSSITRASPVGMWRPAGVRAEEAAYLQQVVHSYLQLSSQAQKTEVLPAAQQEAMQLRQKLCAYQMRK